VHDRLHDVAVVSVRDDAGFEETSGLGIPSVRGQVSQDVARARYNVMEMSTPARHRSELVRLKKYVVTENVQQTVPVEREEVRIEREPITDEHVDAAMSGQHIGAAFTRDESVTLLRVEPLHRSCVAMLLLIEHGDPDSAIDMQGYRNLEEGQRVEFDVGPGTKGEEAQNVRMV
jgi:hypothetical protein